MNTRRNFLKSLVALPVVVGGACSTSRSNDGWLNNIIATTDEIKRIKSSFICVTDASGTKVKLAVIE